MASSQNGEYGRKVYGGVDIERRLEQALNENEAARIRRMLKKQGLNKPLNEPKAKPAKKYIDPDTLFTGDYIDRYCLIFTPAGNVYYESGDITHMDMLRSPYYTQIAEEFGIDMDRYKYDWFVKNQGELLTKGLFGRIAKEVDTGVQHISFWNTPVAMFQKLIGPCLEQLAKCRVVSPDTLVHHPSMDGVPAGEVLGGGVTAKRNPEAERQYELARQMHLMRGDEKKAVMKKLGVGGGGIEPKLTHALKKANLLNPGQKWWAQTSEGLERGSV